MIVAMTEWLAVNWQDAGALGVLLGAAVYLVGRAYLAVKRGRYGTSCDACPMAEPERVGRDGKAFVSLGDP